METQLDNFNEMVVRYNKSNDARYFFRVRIWQTNEASP